MSETLLFSPIRKERTVTLTVKDYTVNVSVDKTEFYLDESAKVTVTHDAGNDADVKITVSNNATLAEDGTLTAKAAGKVTITVSCEGKFEVTKEVIAKANYVTLTEDAITLKVDDSETLADFVETSSKDVTWTIEGDAAKIEDGSVVAVAAGSATLTATCGEASDTITVTVAEPEVPKFVTTADSVKATANDDGSITVVTTENYNGIRFSIPSTDAKVGQVIVNVTTNEQIGIQVYGKNGTMLAGDYPGYDYTEAVTKDYVLYVDPFVDVPSSIQIQANGDGDQTFTVNSVKIVTEDLVKYTDLIVYPGGEKVTVTSNEDGSATITSTEGWTTAYYQFEPNNVTLDGKTTVKVEVETEKAVQILLVNDDWSEQVPVQAGYGLQAATTLILGIGIPEGKTFTQICYQPSEAQTSTIKSITFSTVLDEIQLN